MKIAMTIGGAALLASLSACGSNEASTSNSAAPASEAGSQAQADTHSASGTVTGISGNMVTISHGPVETLGWPAMTMGFRADSPELLQGVASGDMVSFEFRKGGSEYVLTSLRKDA